MKIGAGSLRQLLLSNVAEIVFLRRVPKASATAYRRMLCTNSVPLLLSENGKKVLHYQAPTRMPKFNPQAKDLVITWDIFMQDFRCVNTDNCELIRTIPANEEFWKYFNEYLMRMTPEEKLVFMNS